MLVVVRRYPNEILLSALVRVSEQAPFYVYTGFIFAYGTTVLGLDRNFLLVPVLVASLLSAIIIPTAGHLSDRVGRRPVYLVGVVGTGIWGFVYFGLLDTRIVVLAFLALALSLVFHDVQWGPQAALIAESFPTRLRYSGSAIGWNLASVIAGGPAPLIATALLAASRSSFTVAVYILVCAVISAIALGLMPERSRHDISVEHEEALEAAGLSPRPGAAR